MRKLLASALILTVICPAFTCRADVIDANVSAGAAATYVPVFDHLTGNLFGTQWYDTYAAQFGFNTRKENGSYAESYNFPVYGLGLAIANYNTVKWLNNSRLENTYSLYGFFERPFWRTGAFSIGYALHLGIAYTNGRYNPYTNPCNEFGGSKLLSYVAVGPQFKWHISSHWEAGINLMFQHHSNGKIAMPNGAINELNLGLFARYHLKEYYRGRKLRSNREIASSDHSWKKGFCFDVGLIGGAKCLEGEWMAYNVWENDPSKKRVQFKSVAKIGMTFDAVYRYSLKCASGIQAEALYTTDAHRIEAADRITLGSDSPSRPLTLGLGAIHEVYYRNFAVYLNFGFYLYNHLGQSEELGLTYQKIGFRYYIPALSDMYLGWCVKAQQFARADYLEFSLGIRL